MDVPVSVREQEPEQISDDWNVRLENGKLTIKTPKNYKSTTEYTVRLYTLLGEKTSEEYLVGNNEIAIKNYQTGVYLCEIIDGQQRKKLLLIAQ
ncbi:MAG: T9SS type A sorting domain-containing protein [Bacteroidetes bacterium]|nr:T9SS type A sorting domain-containing protein [Bacteroidota bacterium]